MPRLRRRRVRPRADGGGGGLDRLSSLPDDLLRLILRCLDTRTALSTAVLARRWSRLPRDLPALDLRVGDMLPPRYHRAVAIRRGCQCHHPDSRRNAAVRKLDAVIAQCERRTARAFADGVAGLLEAAGAADDGGDDRRRAKTLRLEFFFPTEDKESGCAVVDRLIPAAIGVWGVEDLEVVVARRARSPLHDDDDEPAGGAYTFPHHRLDDALHRSRLRRLTLANCAAPRPLQGYAALAELVLRDMPATTPLATYRDLFTARSPLQVLHLISCRCADEEYRHLVISAPDQSKLRELVVDGCSFLAIDLRALPALERLACLTNTVELRYSAVPRLARVTLAFSEKSAWWHDELGRFLDGASAVESLAARLSGPSRWFVARPPKTLLRGLTRLLVADVPASWDVTWPRLLLVAAPHLETLHIHVAPQKYKPLGREISWNLLPSRKVRHRRLKEVVVAGFGRTWRQIFFVRYLARVCKRLQRVFLLKDWRVRERSLWDWDLEQQNECPWSDEDKMVIRKQIMYGKTWCRPQLQVNVR